MTGGLLDFFTLEASEYVEELDGLVSRASAAAPDPALFGRTVRALRGSATMAKVDGIASLAVALERLAKQVKDGQLPWDAASRGVAVSTIDDAKILIRAVRSWGAAEDARVAERVAEIDRIAPKAKPSAPAKTGNAYLAAAAADAAAGLLAFAENPGAPDGFAAVMDKVRALRGVAALKDLPPLAEVVDAVDAAAKAIEIGQDSATAERRRLFRAAARVLLEGGDAVRAGGVPPLDSVAVREFAHASATLGAGSGDGDDVVPIAALLATGEDTVQPSTNPPTTAAQRFRLEVVSQAEHLRRLVSDGRAAADAATRERLSRELRGAVRALARAAQSFGAVEISNLFIAAERSAADLVIGALDVLDRAAMLLSANEAAPEAMAGQFVALSAELSASSGRATPSATPVSAPPRSTPARSSTPASIAPSGQALHELLSTGIAGLSPLGEERLAEPLVGDVDVVIPVVDLLFRGKDALQHALVLGVQLRAGTTAPDPTTLAELYDLLQLAAAE
jgi:chemotaxis protein histidine kinase CheA